MYEEELAFYEGELVRVKEARIKALQNRKKFSIEEERMWEQEIEHLQNCIDLVRSWQKEGKDV